MDQYPQLVTLVSHVEPAMQKFINGEIMPFGDFGTEYLYWFDTTSIALGNIIFTTFDRETTLGINSYSVRYGAATRFVEVLFGTIPKGNIPLVHVMLPNRPPIIPPNGQVIS